MEIRVLKRKKSSIEDLGVIDVPVMPRQGEYVYPKDGTEPHEVADVVYRDKQPPAVYVKALKKKGKLVFDFGDGQPIVVEKERQ